MPGSRQVVVRRPRELIVWRYTRFPAENEYPRFEAVRRNGPKLFERRQVQAIS